jgi:hypothetical protein
VLPSAAPIRIETYAGGHMLYLRPESREALNEDVKGMYERAFKAASWPEDSGRVDRLPERASTDEPAATIR